MNSGQKGNLIFTFFLLPPFVSRLDGGSSEMDAEPDEPDVDDPGLLPHQWTLSVPPSHLID